MAMKIKTVLNKFGASARAWASNPPPVVSFIARTAMDEQLTLRAMSLVYTTLLSLIPLLAVSFTLVKALDVHIRIEEILINALAPLGDTGTDLARRVVRAVEEVDLKILGTVGFLFLLYKSIFLIYTIELALNHIWRVEGPSRILRRFGDYLLVLLIGPILLFAALGLTFSLLSTPMLQWLLSIRLLGSIVTTAGKFLPYLIVVTVLAFIYMLLPDTKVRFRSALVGAFIAGIGWEAAGWIFAVFTVSSADYPAVYSGFALPILFLMWLYVSWLILLIGAQIAFFHQYPMSAATGPPGLMERCRVAERISLSIMYLIGERFSRGEQPWNRQTLAKTLNSTEGQIQEALDRLRKKGLIAQIGNGRTGYLPGRDIKTIALSDILELHAVGRADVVQAGESTFTIPPVEEVLKKLNTACKGSLADTTLEELVASSRSN